ncbi:MAG: acyl-CoA desaturase, partial [Gammaproteobacteria bacterium]
MWYQGLLDLSWWQITLVVLVLTHITIVSVTVYLHRHSAHRALDLHPALAHFFRFWLWLTTGMLTREWTAIHRKHHAHCETEQDPHSPVVMGLSTVLLRGAELYQAGKTPETLEKYGKGTPDDWVERNVYSRFPILGVSLMLVIDLLLFGAIGLTVWAVQMLWIPFLAAGVINGLGHWFGYRNFECSDAATNIVPWGILIGGEELHNNHHSFPSSAKLSVRPWEFDLGWAWIRLFSALGLARVKRLPPEMHVSSEPREIDTATIRALVSNRLQVMARYRDEVIAPAVRELQAEADRRQRRLLGRARSLLLRDERLLDARGQAQRAALLEQPVLQRLHEEWLHLQAVWQRRAKDN